MNIKERLKTLEKLNANPTFVNQQLYRLLYSEELYIMAYDNLRSNYGAMTAGISGLRGTADGMNMDIIRKVILSLKDQSYQPKPARRVYIPKANGKQRPLGMPDFKDKLVQEGVKIILTCIYDSSVNPTFRPSSYGFRKGLGCHHALKRGYETFEGCAWIIKADVKAFFDEVDHHILINLLKKRINDQRFINLIWKLLRCGYMENGQLHKPKKGTPQGGNVSPILANIYLHEFDLFIEELQSKQGTVMKKNPDYSRESSTLRRAKNKVKSSSRFDDENYADKVNLVNQLDKRLRTIPSLIVAAPNKAVFSYIRYADDWILGLKCTKAVAKDIYDQCEKFFQTKLALKWNKEKSTLSRSTDRDFEFLGVNMHFVNPKQVRVIKKKSKTGNPYKFRSVPINTMHYLINAQNIFNRLRKKGFVDGNNKPISNKKMINQDIVDIVKTFQSTMRGIINYYRFVHNVQQLNHIYYVLFVSLCKTLAHKGKTRKRQIMKKYEVGRKLVFRYGVNRQKELIVPFYGGLNRDVKAFQIRKIFDDLDPIPKTRFVSTAALWLRIGICGLCGNKGATEMHHVRHVRRQGQKYQGFDKVLNYINRKQIPLCHSCHQKVHSGQYDGINIEDAAKQFYKNLGFKKWKDRENGLTNSTIN